jgi:glycosyltransferase involved in cell wall biosynthesis
VAQSAAPAIAANRGATAEIVHDGGTGLHFQAGNPADLAARVEWAWVHRAQMKSMGAAARAEFESKYTAERNLRMLVEIYDYAISLGAGDVAPACANA